MEHDTFKTIGTENFNFGFYKRYVRPLEDVLEQQLSKDDYINIMRMFTISHPGGGQTGLKEFCKEIKNTNAYIQDVMIRTSDYAYSLAEPYNVKLV
jgi:hypothetical protein